MKIYDAIIYVFKNVLCFHLFLECGKSKSYFINEEDSTSYLDGKTGYCTSIRISDRFILTAAHCMESFSRSEDLNAIEIRTGTDFREAFGVRRYFYHPLREPLYYKYNFAIIELGEQNKVT